MRLDVPTGTIGVLLIWIGITMASTFDNEIEGLTLLVAGGILLAGAVIAGGTKKGDATGLMIGGVIVGLIGLNDYLDSQKKDLPVGAIIVIAIGVILITNAFRNRGKAHG